MKKHKDSAPKNHLLEISFQSKKDYQDPFSDVQFDAVFIDPYGKQLTVPGFWAGEHCWKIRYASSIIGTHKFTTQCSDPSNTQLHQAQGSVTVTNYTGENPLLKHGAATVASDKRHFTHGDGTPFFWLGDTWWMGLTNRLTWPESFKQLASDRQQKGFSVVQIVAGLYPDMAAFDDRGRSDSGFPWHANFSTINPAFFDEADERIFHLVSLGMTPCILGCWGYYLQWMGVEKMKWHWRYIMARWGALPVIWTAAGEQAMPWYLSENKQHDHAWLKQSWSEVITYIRSINTFNRMITTHPQRSARDSVNDPMLLDFEMQQTGHSSPTLSQAFKAKDAWLSGPTMPVVNGESRYEALAIKPPVQSKDTRQAFWAHMLSSGCAGHTYGANGIWQVNVEGCEFGKSPNGHNWGNTPWNKAMHLPAALHLSIAKKLLLTLPWYTLQPVIRQQKNPFKMRRWQRRLHLGITYVSQLMKKTQRPIASAISSDGSFSIHYTVHLKTVLIDTKDLNSLSSGFWFDPTSGEKIIVEIPTLKRAAPLKLKHPGYNSLHEKDWLLILDSPTTS